MVIKKSPNRLVIFNLKKKDEAAINIKNFLFLFHRHYKCDSCTAEFRLEALLKIHNLEHEPDSSDEQQSHVCPACHKKCPTQRQLILHVVQHALPTNTGHTERVKCPVCYKHFAHRDRLQVNFGNSNFSKDDQNS